MLLNPDHHLDAVGLLCPEPVMMLHNKVRDMGEGQVLRMVASDPSSMRDIPKFCSFLGHVLLAQTEEEGEYIYLIKKGG